MDKKGEMGLRAFIIGIILISFTITIFSHYLYSYMGTNGITPDNNFSVVYSRVNASLGNNTQIGNEFMTTVNVPCTEPGLQCLSDTGGETSVLKLMYTSIKLPFSQLTELTTVMSLFATYIGVPGWVVNTVIAIIGVILATIIIYLVFRVGGT
jgi:hypothetical protein